MNGDKAHEWFRTKERPAVTRLVASALLLGGLLMMNALDTAQAGGDDAKIVADLDTRYQLAVKHNDVATMDRILHEQFTLVVGTGDAYTRDDLLKTARDKKYIWDLQDEEAGTQKVRLYGDTAVVTAKLLIKARTGGQLVEKALWFSDTYVRTPTGWRYAFGQASLALPPK